jgi:hypothetical protein
MDDQLWRATGFGERFPVLQQARNISLHSHDGAGKPRHARNTKFPESV